MRMKNKNYTLPLALVFSLFFLWAISSNLLPTMIRQLMKTWQQPVAYDDTAADEDVRIEYVRGFVYRISLLAGIFYLPDTYRYVYEAV